MDDVTAMDTLKEAAAAEVLEAGKLLVPRLETIIRGVLQQL